MTSLELERSGPILPPQSLGAERHNQSYRHSERHGLLTGQSPPLPPTWEVMCGSSVPHLHFPVGMLDGRWGVLLG